MRNTLPLLDKIRFPAIRRGKLETLQINVGYRCNQSCVHCHVNAGPGRSEEMGGETIDLVLEVLSTGGFPRSTLPAEHPNSTHSFAGW